MSGMSFTISDDEAISSPPRKRHLRDGFVAEEVEKCMLASLQDLHLPASTESLSEFEFRAMAGLSTSSAPPPSISIPAFPSNDFDELNIFGHSSRFDIP